MKKNEFVELLKSEIIKGEGILRKIQNLQECRDYLGDGMAVLSYRSKNKYNPTQSSSLTNDLTLWERRVYEVLKNYFGTSNKELLKEFTLSDPKKWFDFKSFGSSIMEQNITALRSYIDRIDFIPVNGKESTETNNKPYKVFISHSGEDGAFVKNLVNLLEFLGVDSKEKLLCSSIPGYQIPMSEDFAAYLLKQFHDYKLFVIIVLSRNYYSSPYSLNEMGAAWVLKTDCFSFLVKGFDYNEMDGVIDRRIVSVKVDTSDARARLNELKNMLIPLFKPQGINEDRWEEHRDEFLNKVNSLPIADNAKQDDLFASCYIPIFDKIMLLIDMPNYQYWTYNWAIQGTPIMSVDNYRHLEELGDFLRKISYHKGYEQYDKLLKNLGVLVSDYINMCDEHIELMGNDVYTIERFYKNIPNNPNYDKLLKEFKEYRCLIVDLTLELTRLLNLILERIREIVPDFHIQEGVFVVDNIEREKTEYKEREKTSSPYPGLKLFVKERSNRNYCHNKTSEHDII